MHEALSGTIGTLFPFDALYDVNRRCLELLTAAARNERRTPPPLVERLRPLFRHSTPDLRRRVAQRGFLLLDMEFQNTNWWHGVQREPDRQWRTPGEHDTFPSRTAVPLARSTVMLAWHSIQADPDAACVVLGLSRGVAEIIGALSISELDGIAVRRHRHLAPRWDDRPALWNELFHVVRSGTPNAVRLVNLHATALLTSALLPPPGKDPP